MEGLGLHVDTLHQIAVMNHRDAIRQANQWRLAHSAQYDQPNWFAQQRRRILCQIGHTLVQLGQRLERRSTIQTT